MKQFQKNEGYKFYIAGASIQQSAKLAGISSATLAHYLRDNKLIKPESYRSKRMRDMMKAHEVNPR